MKKPALLILLLVAIIVMLSIVRTYVSNNIATSGVILGAIEGEIGKLKTDNAILAEKLYEQSSLTSIASRVTELGFTDNKVSYVLSSGLPVAYKQ